MCVLPLVADQQAPVPQEKNHDIVSLTQHSKPDGEAHWSCRSMTKVTGVSPATVQRVWHARGLRPHLVEAFNRRAHPPGVSATGGGSQGA